MPMDAANHEVENNAEQIESNNDCIEKRGIHLTTYQRLPHKASNERKKNTKWVLVFEMVSILQK